MKKTRVVAMMATQKGERAWLLEDGSVLVECDDGSKIEGPGSAPFGRRFTAAQVVRDHWVVGGVVVS